MYYYHLPYLTTQDRYQDINRPWSEPDNVLEKKTRSRAFWGSNNDAIIIEETEKSSNFHDFNPSLVGGGRKVVAPNFQILVALKWNIWWFQTCCKLGHINTLCILGHQKISKFSLYLSYSTCDEVNKIFLPN